MQDELKACPFCGSPAVTAKSSGLWVALCVKCFAEGTPLNGEAEAITAWNTRAPDPALAAAQAEVARLRDLLIGSTERMAATLAAMDKYNEKNGTHIVGPSLLGLGLQIAANRAALVTP
jgi:Lar family restriction alleviation protein